MTGTAPGALEGLWPYMVVVLVGALPTGCWRLLGLVFARGLKADSELLTWVRLVASTLLVAVVAKLLFSPSGTLAAIPAWGRYGSIVAGFSALFLFRRSIVAAVLVGEAVLLASGFFAL